MAGRCVVPDVEVTAQLVQASDAGARVRLRYGIDDEREWDIEIDPWAVVVRHRRWYLLGWSHDKSARRVLRVDRVRSVEVLPQRFEAPADLDALAALEEQLSMGWKYDVEVVINAPVAECRHWLPRSFGRLEEVDDGTARLVATTDEPEWYAAQLANLPFGFRLVRSPEVRAAMVVLGRRLLDATDPPDPGADLGRVRFGPKPHLWIDPHCGLGPNRSWSVIASYSGRTGDLGASARQ